MSQIEIGIARGRSPTQPFPTVPYKEKRESSLGITGSPESICVTALSTDTIVPDSEAPSGGQMYLPAKFAVRIALLSCCALACAANTIVLAQETAQPKPTVEPAKKAAESKANPAEQRKMGTDLDGPVIVNTDLITLTVTVTDTYGRYVSGLTKNAFTLLDQKMPQEITHFSDDDSPVSVGVIFDVSGSMSGEKVKKAREALSKFIQTSHNSDEYFLIGFNSRAQLLLDKTRDGNAVLDKLMFVETKNNTALYDACYLGVEKVQRGAHPKRALLLISDGQDNNSRYTFGELRRLLKESDVVLYGIGILSGADAGSSLGMEGQGILDELANISGGKAFFPRSAVEMDDIFEQIALELRHQYSIGYKPNPFINDGKWHKIKVKVTPPRGLPKLFVRSKEGYFAVVGAR